MDDSKKRRAAPESGTRSRLPTAEEAAADPEIAALTKFEPMHIQYRVNGWHADAQRAFVAMLAITGSKRRAAEAIDRDQARVGQLLKEREDAAPFARAVEAALELYERRHSDRLTRTVADAHRDDPNVQAPDQALNEYGEWEDKDSLARRGGEAGERIVNKLLRLRRIYLQEICPTPAKRAAFEILTDLPIDWEKAARGEAQADEPYRDCNQWKPDMVLLAESGWSWGEIGYGPDRKAEQRRAIDEHRAERGLEPIDWGDGFDS